MDGISRPHLPAELTDDVDRSRAAVLRELVPHSLVDLSLSEYPAWMLGQVGQCKKFQMRELEELALPPCSLLAEVEFQSRKGQEVNNNIRRKITVYRFTHSLYKRVNRYKARIDNSARVSNSNLCQSLRSIKKS